MTTPISQTPDASWASELLESIPAGNIPTLLMVLLHLTGDTRWLDARYQCSRIHGLDDNDSGGLTSEIQMEVRDAARDAILAWKAGKPVGLHAPEIGQLVEMMQLSLGENIPDSYGPMVAAWLGLDPEFSLNQKSNFNVPAGFHALVIGAGVAGICAAIRLQEAGIPYTVIEKNAEVGGTWYENHYPGAGVDTPNHIYSYSFAKSDWSRYFALRDEIQEYFKGVATQFDIRKNISFNTRVESSVYDESRMDWVVRVVNAKGTAKNLRANILISAVGLLNVPKIPDIKGLDTFKGTCFHTARWPKGLDLKGKRVAVIGNGASAMQIVPAIASDVASLSVFQRSKQWAAPFDRFQKEVPHPTRFLLREVPYYQEWYRQRLAWVFNDRIHSSLQIDPDWPHPERSINRRNDKHREFFTDYIKAELGNRQDLLPQLLPDYPAFGKRMLMDNGWYRTMTRENVHLVNDPISEIAGNAVVTSEGARHEVDVLIIATGFDAINLLSSFNLVGRGGRSVREAWDKNGAEAYLGMTTPDFPNFFMLAGPNTALGHGGSVVAALETQMRYVMGLLKQVMKNNSIPFEIEVRKEIHDDYNNRVQQAHDRMIWTHKGMSNWYRNSKGRVVAPTPFRNDDYWHMTRKSELSDFLVRSSSAKRDVDPAGMNRESA